VKAQGQVIIVPDSCPGASASQAQAPMLGDWHRVQSIRAHPCHTTRYACPHRAVRKLEALTQLAVAASAHRSIWQPRILVSTRRVAGFVTDSFACGFTPRHPLAPGARRHVTHGLWHPRVLDTRSRSVLHAFHPALRASYRRYYDRC